MVFCTYCGQSFTRDEHLERHILTHTNVKPFKCLTCHMSFARRDLLQRHYTVHGRDANQQEIPASNGMIPKSAGRTPIACSNCAKTKTKCDKKFPCSRCAGRNLKCTLRPTRRATKNAQRVGVGPEGAVIVAPGSATVAAAPTPAAGGVPTENGVMPSQTNTSPRPPALTPLKPASPKNLATPIAPAEHPTTSPLVEGAPTTLPALLPPQPFDERPAGGPTPPTTFSPPMHTINGFVQTTPMSGYDEFAKMSQDSSEASSSPGFMLDWTTQISAMPMGYEEMGPGPHPIILNTDMPFDPASGLPLAPHADGMLTIIPDLPTGVPSLITPIETPKSGDRRFSMDDLAMSLRHTHPHQQHHHPHPQHIPRNMSMPSLHLPTPHHDLNGELSAIIAAQDAWSVFRCTPVVPSISCPKTAKLNLERLEQTLRNHDGWTAWTPQWTEADCGALGDHLTVMQLHESTRDKLLAITQSFLHKALDIHRDNGTSTPTASNFVLLPPARVLEYFLRSYANGFERYFPLTSRGILDANELMHGFQDRAASLLVLLMIAQGAMNVPWNEARMLTGGLTEACRISLFDLIEKNVVMSGEPVVLHAALLFTSLAAWSGDKWQMDIAMGQRGMYFAMLRHSGALDHRPLPPHAMHTSTDGLWSEWIVNEARSRLVYSWVMVDQDMALFHDTMPLFSVNEFSTPMPDADRLWQARSAAEWSSIFEQVHEFSGFHSSVASGARPLALRDLFRHFLDDEMITLGIEMTPLQLRLLLHPLQTLVCQHGQLLSCFSDPRSSRNKNTPRVVSAASTRSRLEEAQSLLQRWYDLAERYLKANPLCAMMHTNLVVFHLISLNAVTDFAEIERLARRDAFDGSYSALMYRHQRCIADVEEAVYHSGQVFRLIRSMPRAVRPPWWAAAIYRVALILWTDSLTGKDGGSRANGATGVPASASGQSFAIDALLADHPLIIRYLTKREGIPCVTKRDGTQMPLDRPFAVLQHCIEVIDEGAPTCFSDGIRAKLERLAQAC